MVFEFFKRLFAGSESRPHTSSRHDQTRTILLVSALRSERDTVRAFSLRYGWHLLVASTLRAAVELQRQEKVTVILYDRDLPEVEWSAGAAALLQTTSACFVLLSSATDEKLRLELLAWGGYDVVRKPVAFDGLAPLLQGYWALRQEINSAELCFLHPFRK